MEILIATNNPAKAREIQAALAGNQHSASPIEWMSLADHPGKINEPEETGSSFQENAALKALYYAQASGMWALADDSGLEVDALNGEPGVHSAYYDRTAAHLPRAERDAANNAKLANALRGLPMAKRTARYRCVMALACGTSATGETKRCPEIVATTQGAFEGLIIDSPRGDGGFGYDPYFLVPELGKTVAELSAEHKNRISHRGSALRMMRDEIGKLLQRL